MELARLEASVRGDISTLRAILSPEYVGINPLGQAATREVLLADIAAGAPDFLAMQPITPIEVDVFGSHAMVRYRMRIELTIFGLVLGHEMWDTFLYERQRGDWRAVWEQTTAVPNNVGLVVEALKKP